jgi:hypothetical protein
MVDKEDFVAGARECAELGLWSAALGYYHAPTGRGCMIGLGAVLAGRLLGDEGLELLPPFQRADFYAAARERLGLPADLCLAADFLFMSAPRGREAELAVAFYELLPEGADLSGAAALYGSGLAGLEAAGEEVGWADRAEAMLAAVVAAGR